MRLGATFTCYFGFPVISVRRVENFDLPRLTAEESLGEVDLSSFDVFLEACRRLRRSLLDSSIKIRFLSS